MAAVRREALSADPDPLDDAMVAAMAGVVDAMRAEGAALEAMRRRMVGAVTRRGLRL